MEEYKVSLWQILFGYQIQSMLTISTLLESEDCSKST
jgi:hypothetical protein